MDVFDLSDEELDAAFKAAKAEQESQEPDETVEEDTTEIVDEVDTDVEEEEVEVDDDSTEEADSEEDVDSEEEGTDEDSTEDSTEEPEGTAEEDATSQEEEVIHKFKANGKEYEITDAEMREQFPRVFGQAMDYTKKLQAIKPWRKTIDAMEQAKLTHADVNLMIDVLKGDPGAISEVLKRTGVDTVELDVKKDELYVAKDYGRDDSALALQDVIEQISSDPEYTVTQRVIEKDWDDASWRVLKESPEKIKQLHIDVKSGLYSQLVPIAEKLKIFDGASSTKSDLDYYALAAREYFGRKSRTEEAEAKTKPSTVQSRITAAQADKAKREATQQRAAGRKAAAPTPVGRGKPRSVDYLNSTDEDFDEWYRKLEERG